MVMQYLVPDKMNIMVSNSDIPGVTFDKVEPWFKTQYAERGKTFEKLIL